MKRYLMTIVAAVLTTLAAKAMPYEMAREEAMYLTDKMAYELNLNQRQYEYAYEINLDYLMGLDRPEDAYGMLLRFRNDDLRSILYDWQWDVFMAADYFFRPVAWRFGRWFYPIYGYYARNYYYYSRPTVYHNYRGGHSHFYHNAGFYVDRRPRWEGGFRGADRGQIGREPNMGMGNRGGMPNMGNRGGMPNMGNRGGMPNMGNPGAFGQQPNMGNRGAFNGQQPNTNTGNRPDMNRGQQPSTNNPNMGNRPDMNRGQQPNVNRGTYNSQQPNVNRGNAGMSSNRGTMTNTNTRGNVGNVSRGNANTGGASRGAGAGAATAGRGHATVGRGGR